MNQDPRGNSASKGAARIRRGVAMMTAAEAEIGPVPPDGALVALVQMDVEQKEQKIAPPTATDIVLDPPTAQEIAPIAAAPNPRRQVPAWHSDYPTREESAQEPARTWDPIYDHRW